jgi:transcriptional regulator with XRE-family HTH domain
MQLIDKACQSGSTCACVHLQFLQYVQERYTVMTMTFPEYLVRLILKYGGSKQDLAKAIGVTPSTLSHYLAGSSVPNLDTLLLLAVATRTSASDVLKAAGKGVLAKQLELLYGEAAVRRQIYTSLRLTPREEQQVKDVRALDAPAQRAIATLITYALHRRETETTTNTSAEALAP